MNFIYLLIHIKYFAQLLASSSSHASASATTQTCCPGHVYFPTKSLGG